ncbi:MAG TPA: hypothetical protein VF316_22010 [Polyangiaceae bacterium]
MKHLAIDEVVITIAQAPRREIRRIVRICEEIPVKVRIMPGIWEILQGNVKVSSIRDVEIEDLLGRDPVRLDEEQLRGSCPAGASSSPVPEGRSARSCAVRSPASRRPRSFSWSARSSCCSTSIAKSGACGPA